MANLFDPPGTPLGTSWHAERDRIRAHLRRRIWKFGFDGQRGTRIEVRVDQIQRRLHKYDPSLAERQARARAAAPPPTGTSIGLTWQELDYLQEHFCGANHPLSASIAEKAAAALDSRPS